MQDYRAQYVSNRNCGCPRCRMKGLMGPAVLITIGVLFLGQEFGNFGFDRGWPILLIVIGIVSFLRHTASTEGHVQPYPYPYPPPMPVPPMPPQQTVPSEKPVQQSPADPGLADKENHG